MVFLGDGEGMSWRPLTPVPEMWCTEVEWDSGGWWGVSAWGAGGVMEREGVSSSPKRDSGGSEDEAELGVPRAC